MRQHTAINLDAATAVISRGYHSVRRPECPWRPGGGSKPSTMSWISSPNHPYPGQRSTAMAGVESLRASFSEPEPQSMLGDTDILPWCISFRLRRPQGESSHLLGHLVETPSAGS